MPIKKANVPKGGLEACSNFCSYHSEACVTSNGIDVEEDL